MCHKGSYKAVNFPLIEECLMNLSHRVVKGRALELCLFLRVKGNEKVSDGVFQKEVMTLLQLSSSFQ